MKNHFSKENLETVVKESKSKAEVLRKLGLAAKGGNYKSLDRWLEEHNINCDHFTGQAWTKDKGLTDEVCTTKLEDLLKENVDYHSDTLKKRLWKAELKEQKCEVCGITEWMGKPISLELHHINGNHYDNRLENLQIVCPNCHSQTEGHRNKGKKNNSGEKLGKKLSEKICPICGKSFKPQREINIYCSRDCYNKSLIQNKEESPYTEENLTKLCNECSTITEVAEKLNTSRPTVRKYLEKYGLLDSFKDKYDFHARKIAQYDIDGNFIKEWPSISDAQSTLNIDHIDKCVNGKRRSAGGFIWREI